ncbi:hypothetical protein [Achromobacter insolitus]|uniref:hypothetical protein n=1 Tax=Achromobacter insolitus TaxID=217204 RepID=UPI0013E3F3B9|nr:hypothetical protein [Achromobacter insolitus]MCP1404568.1 putative phage protein gp47/JayE [Achromobacter insolitus]NGT16914.1 hypothetical protein [Achromobacter insolitus]
MAYGVTPDGFVRPRLPEIRQEIVADLRARMLAAGFNGTVETRPDSITGLLIDTFAEREAALWEQTEGVYFAMYPGSATGVSLDRSVSFTGVTRYRDERSRAYVVLYGAPGTTVPAGAQIRHQVSQNLWALAADAQIQPGAGADVVLRPSVAPNSAYRVSIDGAPYTYTTGPTTNLPQILAGLVAALSPSGLIVSSDGAMVRIHTDGRVAAAFTWTANLSLVRLGSPALAETMVASTEGAAVGDLNGVVTQVDGWDSVDNLQAGVAGRLAESAAELRARYPTGLFRLGAATAPSIAPNVRDRVAGVRTVKVFMNNTDDPDALGRPPHSVHVVVDGGLDDEVAEAIFRVAAAGIDTHGQQLVVVKDDEGADQPIRFDRPERVFIWVRCATTLLPPSEQAFPPGGFQEIAENLAAAGEAFTIGEDVILQRLYGAIYRTPGLASVDLRLAFSTNPAFVPQPADYKAANVAIQDFQVAAFDLSRIEVT